MAQQPHHPQSPRQAPLILQPQKPPSRKRFRWTLFLGIPAVVLFLMWLAQGLDPSFSWSGILQAANVRDTERFTMLATLGVLGCAICLVWRVLRSGNGKG